MRRAVGTAAVESLTDMEAAINGQGLAVTQVRADIAALARDHAVFKKATTEHLSNQDAAVQAVAREAVACAQVVNYAGFWRRLRWLVTGH